MNKNKIETFVDGAYLSTMNNTKNFQNYDEIAKDMEDKNIIVAGSNRAFNFGKLVKKCNGTYVNIFGNVIKFKWGK